MSYDLRVYATEKISTESLLNLLHDRGLAVDGDESGPTLTVVRGARRAYSFSLGQAESIEAEDVPEEVTAVLIAPRYMYELLVEGSSTSEVPHAVRFARKLAQASSGVVLDEQEGTLWARGTTRTPPKVERGVVDIVEARWWVAGPTDPGESASLWLDLARRHLPEALPRRWGTYEPLSQKAAVGQPDAFARYLAVADGTVYFKASAPAIEGRLGNFDYGRHVDSHSLSIHRAALEDAQWRLPLQRFFVTFAKESRAILATAEVIRNVEWSGRGLSYSFATERAPYLAAREGWTGLPPYPTWWTWFGTEYVPLVQQHLPADRVTLAGESLFHWRSEEPSDRDQLAPAAPASRSLSLFRRSRQNTPPWLPTELLAVQPLFDPQREAPPYLTPAPVRPDSLT